MKSTPQIIALVLMLTVTSIARSEGESRLLTDLATATDCAHDDAGYACTSEDQSWLSRTTVSLEYLLWFNKGRQLPALVTTGDPATTPFTSAGILPAAPILFGDERVGTDLQSGARLSALLWLDDCNTTGILTRFYTNEGDRTRFNASSTGNPILAVPFNDQSAAFFGLENALVVGYSGGLTPGIDAQGGIDISADNDVLGSDLLLRTLLWEDCRFRLDVVGGYQFARIDDDLSINTDVTRFDLAGDPQFITRDLFDVENEYHAGTLGLMGEFTHDKWTLSILGKIGLGNMRQQVAISGSNTVISGGSVTTPGGLFAQTTPPGGGPAFNIGTHVRNAMVWSPELNVKGRYDLSDRLSVSVGYTFLYWNRVALAGDQLDRLVNRDVVYGGAFLAGGGSNPSHTFRDTDFWVQAIDLGLTLTF